MDIIETVTKKFEDIADEVKAAVEKSIEDRTCPECFCVVTPQNKDKHVAALHADKSPAVDDATA